jgi:hypothetical protein
MKIFDGYKIQFFDIDGQQAARRIEALDGSIRRYQLIYANRDKSDSSHSSRTSSRLVGRKRAAICCGEGLIRNANRTYRR